MKYIEHIIKDEITHHIQFRYNDQDAKIKTIDYLSTYSNQLLIRKIYTIPVTFQSEKFTAIVMECRCDIKCIKNFTNYLVS